MNLGKDFLAPKEKGVSYSGDPWVPATPHKPDMWDSNPTPIGMQGNQRSMIFPDLVHSSTRLLPEKPVMWRYPFSHPELLVNQRASSSLEALIFGENNLSSDRSVPRSSETNGAGRQGNPRDNANWQEPQGIFGTLSPKMQIPSSAPGMQGIRDSTNWQELMGVYSGLLQQTTPSNAFQNVQSTGLLNHGGFNLQGNPVVPNQGNSSSNLQQMSNDAYPMLNQHSYNLNFPPAEVVGASTSCFQIAPVTPDKGKQAENQQQASTIRQEVGNSCEKLMQSGIASESSNSIMEKNVAGDVGFEGIDLNKTPQQKTPRRKKHRPKVVVEGKQRRTPKPTPSTTQPSNEKPSGKKKYVRRKGQGSTSSAQDSEAQPVEVPGVQSGAKTCKRMLNFDVEGKMQEKTGDNQPESRNESFDLNLTSQGTSSSMGSNRVFTIPAAKIEQKKRYSAETQQGKKPFDLMNSTNQKSTQRFLPLHPIAPTATARDHTLNVIARTIKQTATTYQNNDQYGYFQVPLQENGASDKQLMLQTRIRSAEGTAEANMERGRKRDYCNISDLKYSPTVNCGVQVSSSPYTNGRWPYSNVETVGNNFKKQRPLSGLKLHRDYMAGPLFLQDTESHRPSLLTGITGQNMMSPPQRVPETNQANETTSPKINEVVKRQMVGLESSLLPFSKEKVLSKDYKKEIGYSPFSGKPREFGAGQNEKQKHATEVEEIICQLKGLQISNSARAVVREGKTALVPYKADGTIVPHEEFNPIRRRKPRPKVDLDPETNRLWDLLMVKPVSESTETMDKDKELWWEDQRKVFRGRVDSFIARMHLLQGDRRFSRWKGSVVDSVVGVFLTQNVSDHLSSSAFMSLAAKFPPRTMPNQTSAWVEEPEVQIIDPDGTITYHGEIQRQPLYKYNSMYELSEQRSDHLISGGVHLGKENNRVTEEEVFSSQNSSESLILQANEDVQSSSDSEVQDQVIMCDANKSHSPKSILQMGSPSKPLGSESSKIPNSRKRKLLETKKSFDWDSLRKQVPSKGGNQKRDQDKMDSLDYEALRHADVGRISETIRERGMNNMLAERIKDFLNRLVRDHGSIDLEWLRDVPPDKAKDYLLSIRGLGLKSVECVRLLTLHHMAFPVDTNVGRIAVRLGWVPLQPLPESLQLHLLELYPVLESIQKYIWPRLCKLDQRTLYELHYQMITFGKVFCTKKNPNCNVCPMRPECRHFASAFASARLALPGPEEKSIVTSTSPMAASGSPPVFMPLLEEWIVNSTIPMAGKESTPAFMAMLLAPPETDVLRQSQYISSQQEPIIEEPSTPEISTGMSEVDIEDMSPEGTDEIPTIDLSIEQLRLNVQSILQERNMEITGDLSRALVALNPANAYIPAPKLKNVSRLRTEHQVYEIPDSHQLLERMDRREPDDPSPYLLAIWTPGETANSTEPPESKCSSQETGRRCNEKTCSACDRIREAKSQTVRGTLLIPCRTAMRGSFPLNGTYFQVNEVFADHETSNNPIEVPRDWLWSLPRRTVYFGTSVSTIFKGLSQIEIQYCFWKGFVCVRGFERETRAPKPLVARLHFPASKKVKSKNEKQ